MDKFSKFAMIALPVMSIFLLLMQLSPYLTPDVLMGAGLLIGAISSLIIGFLLWVNHATRIIEIVIGAIHYYFVYHSSVGANLDSFIGGFMWAFTLFDLLAAFMAIYEVYSLIKFVLDELGVDTSSKPSPYSHAMGGLASWLSSFFR